MVQYIAERPGMYQQMLALAERLAALASLPEDAPEVDRLIEEVSGSEELRTMQAMQAELSAQLPQMTGTFADVMGEIANETLSPAQKRFLEVVQQKLTMN